MKLLRINNVKEFFDSFPKATTILNQTEREFSNNMEMTMKKINVSPQMNFSGDHELYYYDILEQTKE